MPTLSDVLNLLLPTLRPAAFGLSVVFVAAMLIPSDWRLALAGYGAMKLVAGLLLVQLLPAEWALLQWVVGGIVGSMWYLSARRLDSLQRRQLGIPWWRPTWRLNPSTFVRLALVLILLAAAYTLRTSLVLPKLPSDINRITSLFALAGLIGLGLGDRPMRWGFSLAMWLMAAHFAIHALQVDASTVGMLVSIELLLGFAISYLIVVDGARFWPNPEDA